MKELRAIVNGNAPDMEQAYKKKFDYINVNYTTDADQEAIGDFLVESYKELGNEAEALLRQVEKAEELREMKEIVPVSYIARRYFGRSAAWLQQRLYGYKVRGRVYTLNDEQKATFDAALQDIARQLSSFSIAH